MNYKSKLRDELINRLDPPPAELIPSDTTSRYSTGRCKWFRQNNHRCQTWENDIPNEGKKVLLAAADTYRAAAVDQLQVWADRLNLPVISGQTGGDPGAVAYDAVEAAKARGSDMLLIDTAGRLHTRFNLMEELKKVHRVVGKALPGAPHGVWLVLDATTGQNALQQARSFNQTAAVTGVILDQT